MQYTIPTTKEEMYRTLNELFMYYRYHRPEFDEEELSSLNVPKMQFTELTAEEIVLKAETLLAPSQEEKLMKAKEKIAERLSVAEKGIETANETAMANIDALKAKYQIQKKEAIDRLVEDKITLDSDYAIIYGYEYSETQDPYEVEYELVVQKNNEIIAKANEVYSAVLAEFNGLEEYYGELFEKEKQAKIVELKAEQDKTLREVFKYNNSIDEKIQRYDNALKQSKATLKLKYMTIQSTGLSKEQLVNLGYYDAVIEVIEGYYSTMSPSSAYADFKNEAKLAIYLDDYHDDMVYLYYMRATS